MVEIEGENFGYSADSTKVRFGEMEAEIHSFSRTTILVRTSDLSKSPGAVNICVQSAKVRVTSFERFT